MKKASKNKEVKIVQKGDPVLRDVARTVPIADIKSAKIQKIIEDMKAALAAQDDGVAIAAPQIGVSLRIFVVSRKVKIYEHEEENISAEELSTFTDDVYINPEIKKLSRLKQRLDEGCLSVRHFYGKVERSDKATITAYNENGEKFTRGASGLLAQIYQHETDHLNGILFVDKADDIVEVPPTQK
jgi:peptide deformylase